MDRPLRVAELDHVVLRCRDPEATRAWYERVLGVVEERRVEGIGLVQLRAGQALIDLIPDAGAEQRAPGEGNVDHFCLGIDATDMDDVVRYLDAAGVERVGEPAERYGARGHGLSVYMRDPEGNVVELKCKPRDGSTSD